VTSSFSKPGIVGSLAQVQRRFWDADAQRYHQEHADYLDTFYWCPERLTEDDAHLLGAPESLAGLTVVEVGCGSTPCGDWVVQHRDCHVIALDISSEMLSRAPQRERLDLIQADAAVLPLADDCADVLFSSFGGYPFVPDLTAAITEAARILRPGGRLIIAANHPMAWIFPDDPNSLTASIPYFQDAYLEWDDDAALRYAEFHHTLGDWIRAFATAGLTLRDLVEPAWTPGVPAWGQWSPSRGQLFPGTAIFIAELSPEPGAH